MASGRSINRDPTFFTIINGDSLSLTGPNSGTLNSAAGDVVWEFTGKENEIFIVRHAGGTGNLLHIDAPAGTSFSGGGTRITSNENNDQVVLCRKGSVIEIMARLNSIT